MTAFDPGRHSIRQIRARFIDEGAHASAHVMQRLQRDRRRGVRHLYEQLRRRQDRERSEALRRDAMLNLERVLWRSGLTRVAGVDEAGVGPLAGPVVAAAVVFPPDTFLPQVDDSKRLDAAGRARAEAAIRKAASGIGIGVAEVDEVDRLNVYRAAGLAMKRAVEALPEPPEHLLVDARAVPGIEVPQNPFNKGDGIDFSIAAASVIAKTHRDRLMEELDLRHPGYGLGKHKGYATASHLATVRRLGPSPVHRTSYPVLRTLCGQGSPRFYALEERLASAAGADDLRGIEEELEAAREEVSEAERRKLRLILGRRWSARGTRR